MQRHVELRMFGQRLRTGFDNERERRELDAFFIGQRFLLCTEIFEIGNVGFIELGDMRNIEPIARHVHGGNAMQLAQFHFFNRTELAEILIGNAGNTCSPLGRRSAGGGCLHTGFHKRLHIFLHDAATAASTRNLGQIDTEFACQFAHSRASVNITTLSCCCRSYNWRHHFGLRRGRSRSCDGFDF